jgi:putative DNA primase/helicase
MYTDRGFDTVWNSDKAPTGGITAATLFLWAKGNGWADPTQFDATPERLEDARPTDVAFGSLIASTTENELLYDHARPSWMHYDHKRWAVCARGEQVERVKQLSGTLLQLAGKALSAEPESPKVKRLMACAARAQSALGIKAGLQLAQSDSRMAVSREDFDRDPELFNTASGVLHLPSGELRAHSPALRLHRLSPVEYRPAAPCPLFRAFLMQISCGDSDWVDGLQRQCGYLLSGHVRDEKLFFWFGEGRNGKSVLANVLQHILGDFAGNAPAAMFMRSRRDGGAATPELAMLPGIRLLLANETEAGSRLSAQMLKVAVSTEHIAARSLYGNPFSFAPTHKVVMRGNHLPIIAEGDEGTWRRIDLWPFDLKLTPEDCDPHLEAKLIAEAPGILAWMVEGYGKWAKDGLRQPRRVRDALLAYRQGSDVVLQWMDDECEAGPTREVAQGPAYDNFRRWCSLQGLRTPAKTSLTRMLAERGIDVTRREGGGARRWLYRGLQLRS